MTPPKAPDAQPNPTVWNLLVNAAKARRTLRYSKLAQLAGFADAIDALRPELVAIRHYCQTQQLPTLSAIVCDDVGSYAGLSSARPDAPWERARVFDYGWAAYLPA
ncbi:MAG: hypothetical protein ACRCYV_05160 [Aeromonas sp.]